MNPAVSLSLDHIQGRCVEDRSHPTTGRISGRCFTRRGPLLRSGEVRAFIALIEGAERARVSQRRMETLSFLQFHEHPNWFKGDREEAEARLEHASLGTYVIRPSSQKGAFAVSIKGPFRVEVDGKGLIVTFSHLLLEDAGIAWGFTGVNGRKFSDFDELDAFVRDWVARHTVPGAPVEN